MVKHHNLIGIALVAVVIVAGVVWADVRSHKAAPQATVTKTTETKDKSATPQKDTPTPAPTSFNKSAYSLDSPTSIWVVVDKQRPLNPKSYAPPDLTSVGSGQYMRAAAAQAYATLVADAKSAGFTLMAESGYRSYDTQVSVYGNEVKNYGQTVADSESARPGYSEHQTGWAVDIGSPGCIEDCFGGTKAGQWVMANAASYGFINRYPADKASITGYRHEPWHFRYVGKELAAEMNKTGQTLEEYFNLPAAPNYN